MESTAHLFDIFDHRLYCPVVRWSGGPVVRWSGGPVVRWSGGPVVRWSGGPVVRWSGGPVVRWSGGPVVRWSGGPVVRWSVVRVWRRSASGSNTSRDSVDPAVASEAPAVIVHPWVVVVVVVTVAVIIVIVIVFVSSVFLAAGTRYPSETSRCWFISKPHIRARPRSSSNLPRGRRLPVLVLVILILLVSLACEDDNVTLAVIGNTLHQLVGPVMHIPNSCTDRSNNTDKVCFRFPQTARLFSRSRVSQNK
jgi:hypothetical protein